MSDKFEQSVAGCSLVFLYTSIILAAMVGVGYLVVRFLEG